MSRVLPDLLPHLFFSSSIQTSINDEGNRSRRKTLKKAKSQICIQLNFISAELATE